MIPKLIGYYNGDEWGSDGWWEEGDTSEQLQASATQAALDSGFDQPPKLTEVILDQLSDLSPDEWKKLWHQWRLARINGWTSDGVDDALVVEHARRDE